MKLTLPPILRKKEQSEYFFALLLRDVHISAILFEEQEGKLQIVGKHEELLPSSLENTESSALLEKVDTCVSTVEKLVSSSSRIQKTIFCLKESWIEEAKIKKEHLITLKKLSEHLDLKPIGFIVFTEAIIHFLQKEEGAPVSSILIEAGKQTATVSIIRASKTVEAQEASITTNLIEATEQALKNFTSVEIFPSRIILFNEESDDELTQTFISHNWSSHLPFLHVPQIRVLSKDFIANAVLFGVAMQMGFSLPQDFLTTKHVQATSPRPSDVPSVFPSQQQDEGDNFGFIQEQDIATLKAEHFAEEVAVTSTTISTSDNKKNSSPRFSFLTKIGLTSLFSLLGTRITSLISLKYLFKRSPAHPSTHPHPPSSGRKKMLFGIPVILGLVVSCILLYVFALKATVILFIAPKPFTATQDITLVPDGSSDIEHNILASSYIETTKTIQQDTKATGVKNIGEKAKGTVVIYNSSLTEGKDFVKGTTISANNLEFTFDSAVSVASASGDASSITSSTAKVSVTASEIGDKYNVKSDTKFTIDSFSPSTLIAKNDTAFSGGSSKTIAVVDKKDIATLLSTIETSIDDNTKDELIQKAGKDNILLTEITRADIIKKDLSKQVGDEASTITLHATVSYKMLAYEKSQLTQLAQAIIKASMHDTNFVQHSFTTKLENPTIQKDDSIQASLSIHASFIPQLNTQALREQLVGKNITDVKKLLQQLPQVSDTTIQLHPALSFLPALLPRIAQNISVIVTVQ